MTHRVVLLMLLLCLCTGRALAIEAIVRSGEHGSFTRLVIDLPKPSAWDLNQNGTQVLLRIPDGVASFDLSQVFLRIDRSRLANLRAGVNKGELVLDLACDCSAIAFLVGSNMLVLDISEVADLTALGTATLPNETQQLSFGSVVREEQSIDLPLLLPGSRAPVAQSATQIPFAPRIDPQTSDAITAAEDRLLRQIGRAATQGLLEPSLSPSAASRAAPGRDHAAAVKPAPHLSEPEPALEKIPLRATNSRDQALLEHLRLGDQGMTDASCLPDTEFAISDWGTEEFGTGLSDWRSNLYGEFDKVNAEAAIGMAKHYLHFGFGAEARRSLALQDRPQPILSILSRILDGDPMHDAGPLPAQASCNGAVALWAVLALPGKEGRIDIDEQAVVWTFMALPDHLRDRLGPELARRLSLFKYGEAAEMVMRRLDLFPKGETPEKSMAQAQIADQEGDSDLAQAARQDVVATGTEQSPLALADMIAGELAEGREITPDLVDLAAAYAYERRGAPEAVQLAWAEIQARAGAGQFEQALQRLDSLDAVEADAFQHDVIYDLMESRTADAEFLTLLLPRLEQASALTSRTANGLAERLLQLGFPTEAAFILRSGASGPDGRLRRVLRAEISLVLRDPRQAEAEILGLAGNDVEELRARASRLASDQAVAARILSSSDATEQTMRDAFVAGEWRQSEDEDNPASAALARLSQPETADLPEAQAGLAHNRALLARSAEARQTLNQLLSTYPAVQPMPFEDDAAPLR